MKSDEELREDALNAYDELVQDKDNKERILNAYDELLQDKDNMERILYGNKMERILYGIDQYFHQLGYIEGFRRGIEHEKMHRNLQVWMSPLVGMTLGFLVGLFGTLYFLV